MSGRYIHDMGIKIDFYSGAHGNFLEMLLHTYVLGLPLDLSKPIFDDNGACHAKYDNSVHREYKQEIGCLHYSVMGIELNPADRVIEIHIRDDHKITVAINNYLRAGDECVDIYYPEKDSLLKLRSQSKTQKWIDWFTSRYGPKDEYPRSAFRERFYGDFTRGNYNQFHHRGPKISFPHEAFFDLNSLRYHLGVCADFLGKDLKLDNRVELVWQDFIDHNQGLKSQQKCQEILRAVEDEKDVSLTDLNVVEEAWIIYQLYPNGGGKELVENFPASTGSILARG